MLNECEACVWYSPPGVFGVRDCKEIDWIPPVCMRSRSVQMKTMSSLERICELKAIFPTRLCRVQRKKET